MKITTQILLLIVLMGCSPTKPKGKGVSISKGTVKNGELINGRRFTKKRGVITNTLQKLPTF